MIRVEDNRSLLAMASREDLHVAFTRHRASARMFVQDIGVLRQVANRSLINDVFARDLESQKIVGFAERFGQALAPTVRFATILTKAPKRAQNRIRQLFVHTSQQNTRT